MDQVKLCISSINKMIFDTRDQVKNKYLGFFGSGKVKYFWHKYQSMHQG